MSEKKLSPLVSTRGVRDPFALLRQMTSELDRAFDDCSEREYGSFYRAVPLPEGVKLEDVKATFADGVLEVSVPLPARAEATVRKVQIEEPGKTAKSAA